MTKLITPHGTKKGLLDKDGLPIRTKDVKVNLPYEERYHKLSVLNRWGLWFRAVRTAMRFHVPTHIRSFVNKDGSPSTLAPELVYVHKKELKDSEKSS